MKMDLKRKVMNELLTTFLPTILLIMITFATTFFKPFFFEAALSVNLTTLLMMTTMSIGKMQVLPTTAYIRMIDLWLVFCQLVPFSEVILLTAQEYYRNDLTGDEEDKETDDRSDKDPVNDVSLVEVLENGIPQELETNDSTDGKPVLQNRRLLQLKTIGDLLLV